MHIIRIVYDIISFSLKGECYEFKGTEIYMYIG